MKSTKWSRSKRCAECNKYFDSNSRLRDHLRIHSNERPFACQKCPAKFKHRSNFNCHVRTVHQTDRNYVCGKCGASFKTAGVYSRHLRFVHSNRYFRCPKCNARFKNPYNRDQHLRTVIHPVGAWPFACSQCEAHYKWSHGLKKHIQSVHERPEYVCERSTVKISSPPSSLIPHNNRANGQETPPIHSNKCGRQQAEEQNGKGIQQQKRQQPPRKTRRSVRIGRENSPPENGRILKVEQSKSSAASKEQEEEVQFVDDIIHRKCPAFGLRQTFKRESPVNIIEIVTPPDQQEDANGDIKPNINNQYFPVNKRIKMEQNEKRDRNKSILTK